jgi:hypothetical protein
MGMTSTLRIYSNDPEMREQKLRELHGLTEFGWACMYMEPEDFRAHVYYAAVNRAKIDTKKVKAYALVAMYKDDYSVVCGCPDEPTLAGTYSPIKTINFAKKLKQFLEAESVDAFREACFRELVGDKLPSTAVV